MLANIIPEGDEREIDEEANEEHNPGRDHYALEAAVEPNEEDEDPAKEEDKVAADGG